MAAVPSIGRATGVQRQAVAPEADATRDLYERYHRQIFNFCMHQLGNREEAEDAVQGTFLNAFRGLKRGITPEHESAWLFKIAENVCLTRRRATFRRGRVEWASDLQEFQDVIPGSNRDTDELMGLSEALSGMPEQQRTAILLREWQGLSYKEIALEMGLTQGAVETLIFRARRSLAHGLDAPEPRKTLRWRHALDLGSVLAGLKTFLCGSAAVKVATTVAIATTATTGTVVATQTKKEPAKPKPAAVVQHVTPAKAATLAPVSIAPAAAPAGAEVAREPAAKSKAAPKEVVADTAPAQKAVSKPVAPARAEAPAALPPASVAAPVEQPPAAAPAAPGQPAAEQPEAEEPRAEQPKAEHPKAEQPRETPRAEEPKAEQPKQEQRKAEEPKAPHGNRNGSAEAKAAREEEKATAKQVKAEEKGDEEPAPAASAPKIEEPQAKPVHEVSVLGVEAPAPAETKHEAKAEEKAESPSQGNGNNGNGKGKGK